MSRNLAMYGPFNIEHPFSWHSVVEPFGDRLRRYAHSHCKSPLASKDFANPLECIFKHGSYIHRQLIHVNWGLIALGSAAQQNQLMIDTPQPDSYSTFAEWLNAFCEYHGSQRAAAIKTKVTPQAMTKWRAGGNVTTKNLQKLAVAGIVDYSKLLLLFNKQPTKPVPIADTVLMTATEMGAKVGRKWEQLHEPARSQMLGVIETFLALQSPSHRKYGEDQQKLIENRPTRKHART